jgi:hypothetical protein
MNKTIRILLVLLALQIVLAIALQLRGAVFAPPRGKPLIAARIDEVDRITIDGNDQSHTVLVKVGKTWQLPNLGGFPADSKQVEQLLNQLQRIAPDTPMATTADAPERFNVADNRFDRRIILSHGDKPLETLYLGIPQGARDMPIRRAGDQNVYGIRATAIDLMTKDDNWAATTALQLPKESIAQIVIHAAGNADDLVLHAPAQTKPGGGDDETAQTWRADGLKPGETLDSAAADNLAGSLAHLNNGSVLGRDKQPDYGLDQPLLTLTLTTRNGQHIDYVIGKRAQKDEYTLKVSTRPEYFSLPSFTAQPLLDAAKRAALLGKPQTQTPMPAPTPPKP